MTISRLHTLALSALSVASLAVVLDACSSGSSGGTATGTPSGATTATGSATGSATTTGAGEGPQPSVGPSGGSARPDAAGQLRMQLDLLELAHTADVDHDGLYIDLGTPAGHKYTLGGWRTGWLRDGADGDETFTYASDQGRLFIDLATDDAITLEFRLRAIGTQRMSIYMNSEPLAEPVVLAETPEFRTYRVTVPAERTRVGENDLLLRFGGTTAFEGMTVSVAMASVRVVANGAAAGEYTAPTWDTVLSQIEIGGVERRAVLARAPTTYSYYLEVPEHAHLVFGVGSDTEGASGTARVRITPEGAGAEQLFEAPLSTRWNDQSLDLARFANQVVRIDFAAEGTGRVAWGAPAVMVDPPAATEAPAQARNVIVLLIDTLRASKLHPYNPQSRVRTPVIDRLATEGTVFERAHSQENWTKPSVASILTGLTPGTHRAITESARLPASAELVSEAFDRANFATASFLANGYVSDRFGFDQGWDHYTNMIRENRSTEAEDVFREAGDWIDQHKSERFFVYIQTIDPHVPYDPPAEYLQMYDPRPDYAGQVRPRSTGEQLEAAKRRPNPTVVFDESDTMRLMGLHDGEISYHDFHLGRFLERLATMGVRDDTLLVVTSDHGEEFHEHGSWGHGHSVYQELIQVPLIMHRPGAVPANLRVAQPVSTMFITQTVLDAAGVSGAPAAEGRSLMPDLRGELPEGPMIAFSNMLDDRRVARARRWKLVLNGRNSKLFDLEGDPGESTEITDFARHPIAARYLRIMLGQYNGATDRGVWWRARQDRRQELGQEQAQMDNEIRDQLRALGYAQ